MNLIWVVLLVLPLVIATLFAIRRLILAQTDMTDLQKKIQNDFAERRAVERELAHMASFSEVAPHPILEADSTGCVFYTNPAALALFPDLSERGRDHPALQGLDTLEASLKKDARSLTTRLVSIGERIYEQQAELLEGSPRLRLYMTDITELKRLDQLKTDFVNMVSHELRTPLSAINASLSMIQQGVLGDTTADQKHALSLALKSLSRLNRMISELLDVSKIEAGKLTLERSRTDLSRLIQEITQSFEPLARERGLDLRWQVDSPPLEVDMDRDKISEVLFNLIQNAMKFTPQGRILIAAHKAEGEVICSVKDSGPGIPPEMLPKMFQKFQQAGSVAHGNEKGTGLGLSLCKGLVELHGGRIWVESKPHQGACFSFSLPTSLNR